MMAEVNGSPRNHDNVNFSENLGTLLVAGDAEMMDQQLPHQAELKLITTQEIKMEYFDNLLDAPSEISKNNMKEKILTPLQENTASNNETHNSSVISDLGTKTLNTEHSLFVDEIASTVKTEKVNQFTAEQNSATKSCSVGSNSTSVNVEENIFQQNNVKQVNNSLKQICEYNSESDSDVDYAGDALKEEELITPSENNEISILNEYRAQMFFSDDSEEDTDSSDDKSDSDTSSSSSSSSSTSSSNSSVAIGNAAAAIPSAARNVPNNAQETNKTPRTKKKNGLRTRGELLIEDLPPIQDLQITVPEEACMEVGKVTSIVEQLVVVQAFKNTPPLDLDSVLFLERGKRILGQIFDVFGQVSEPLYCVRFNSASHIKEKEIQKDMLVYCAPKTEHTSYVFVPDLLRMRGCDASWEDNNEPPPKWLDYSDDEQEQRAKKAFKSEKKVTDEGSDQPKKKKNRSNSFERRMNERNLRMTAMHANQPAAGSFRPKSNNSSNNNNNSNPFTKFDNPAWWSRPMPPNQSFHRPSRPPPPSVCTTPARLIHPPTFTLPPPPRFVEMPPHPLFTSPPPPRTAYPNPITPSFFPPYGGPFLPYNHGFPPTVPAFDPNRPPPPFGFSPSMPPQLPPRHPPP